MKKHFVTFYSPGSFVAEESTLPIDSWDVAKAKEMAKGIKERYGATPYGFQFTTRSRSAKELDSKITETSPLYWLGGKIETLAQVKKRATDRDRILLSNMEYNGWKKIITNSNSYSFTQPLGKTDIVLEWP